VSRPLASARPGSQSAATRPQRPWIGAGMVVTSVVSPGVGVGVAISVAAAAGSVGAGSGAGSVPLSQAASGRAASARIRAVRMKVLLLLCGANERAAVPILSQGVLVRIIYRASWARAPSFRRHHGRAVVRGIRGGAGVRPSAAADGDRNRQPDDERADPQSGAAAPR